MNKSTKIIITSTVAAAILAGGIWGGITVTNSISDTADAIKVIATETAQPVEATEAPAPAVDAADLNGDGKVTEREKELVAKQSYTLLDGTTVPAPKQGEAVPEAIIENIQAKASDSIAGMQGSGINVSAEEAFIDTLREEQTRIGRKIIPVFHATDGACGCLVWAVSGDADGKIKPSSTMQAAVDQANAFAAGKDRYVVIVFA